MSIRFVSTSVLSSSDGVDFNVETKLETEEVKEARKAAERAANKPLFQQLAEREEAKKMEYDLNTRRMNAPPKALDEEDVNHLNSLAEKEQTDKQARLEQEELELEAFRVSRTRVSQPLVDNPAPSTSSTSSTYKIADQALFVSSKRKTESEPRIPIVVSKPKKAKNATEGLVFKSAIEGSEVTHTEVAIKQFTGDHLSQKKETVLASVKNVTAPKATNSIASLLGGYGSGSSDSEDS